MAAALVFALLAASAGACGAADPLAGLVGERCAGDADDSFSCNMAIMQVAMAGATACARTGSEGGAPLLWEEFQPCVNQHCKVTCGASKRCLKQCEERGAGMFGTFDRKVNAKIVAISPPRGGGNFLAAGRKILAGTRGESEDEILDEDGTDDDEDEQEKDDDDDEQEKDDDDDDDDDDDEDEKDDDGEQEKEKDGDDEQEKDDDDDDYIEKLSFVGTSAVARKTCNPSTQVCWAVSADATGALVWTCSLASEGVTPINPEASKNGAILCGPGKFTFSPMQGEDKFEYKSMSVEITSAEWSGGACPANGKTVSFPYTMARLQVDC